MISHIIIRGAVTTFDARTHKLIYMLVYSHKVSVEVRCERFNRKLHVIQYDKVLVLSLIIKMRELTMVIIRKQLTKMGRFTKVTIE